MDDVAAMANVAAVSRNYSTPLSDVVTASGVASQSGSALSGAAAMTVEYAVLAGRSVLALWDNFVTSGMPQVGQEGVLTGQSARAPLDMSVMTGRPQEGREISKERRECARHRSMPRRARETTPYQDHDLQRARGLAAQQHQHFIQHKCVFTA